MNWEHNPEEPEPSTRSPEGLQRLSHIRYTQTLNANHASAARWNAGQVSGTTRCALHLRARTLNKRKCKKSGAGRRRLTLRNALERPPAGACAGVCSRALCEDRKTPKAPTVLPLDNAWPPAAAPTPRQDHQKRGNDNGRQCRSSYDACQTNGRGGDPPPQQRANRRQSRHGRLMNAHLPVRVQDLSAKIMKKQSRQAVNRLHLYGSRFPRRGNTRRDHEPRGCVSTPPARAPMESDGEALVGRGT
jgi:hypothetical protein